MEKNYNPKQNYYFVDYTLWEKGHPEYIEVMKKEGKSLPEKGTPRWVRSSFNTEQDVQERMNFLFFSYPDRVTRFRVRSEKELNEIVTIDEKTHKILYENDEGFDEGIKITQREYDFGGNYQWIYDHTTGVIDDDGNPINKDTNKSNQRKDGKK